MGAREAARSPEGGVQGDQEDSTEGVKPISGRSTRVLLRKKEEGISGSTCKIIEARNGLECLGNCCLASEVCSGECDGGGVVRDEPAAKEWKRFIP